MTENRKQGKEISFPERRIVMALKSKTEVEGGNEQDRFASWKWLAGILMAILLAVGGYTFGTTVGDMKIEIKALYEKKLDKDQYIRDMTDIKETLLRMDAKLDRLRR